jgi:hypothetical protein
MDPSLLAAIRRIGNEPLAFYVVAAGIIPILFLAMLYQSRIRDTKPTWPRYVAVAAVTFAALRGEIYGLRVLAHGYVISHHAEYQVIWALIVIGAFVLFESFLLMAESIHAAFGGDPSDRKAIFAGAVLLAGLSVFILVEDGVISSLPPLQ